MNLRKITLLLLSLLAVSCGGDNKKYWIESPELEFYVKRFEQLSLSFLPTKIDNLVVKFDNLTFGTAGLCIIRPKKAPEIFIDHAYWQTLSDAGRENLMFHELGHCILYRDHITEKDSKGNPVSLMYPRIIPNLYEKNMGSYIEELFSITRDMFNLIDDEEKIWSCNEKNL